MKHNYFILNIFLFSSIICNCFAGNNNTKTFFPISTTLTKGMSTDPYILVEQDSISGDLDFGSLTLSNSKGGIIKMNPENGNLSVVSGTIGIKENGNLGQFNISGYGLTKETPVQISFEDSTLASADGYKKLELRDIQSKEISDTRGVITLKPQTGVNPTKNSFTTSGTLIIPENATPGDYEGYYTIICSY